MKDYFFNLLDGDFFPHIISILLFIFYLIFIKICYRTLNKLKLKKLLKILEPEEDLNEAKPDKPVFFDRGMRMYLYSILIKLLRVVLFTMILIFTLPALFYINPPTKIIATKLLGLILLPLQKVAMGILEYLPNLFTIIVIVLVLKYSLEVFRYISVKVESEKLKIPGFYPEWAGPTYNLLKLFLYLMGLVILSPYLPGAGSAAFKGITVFVGFIVSLGSSSYVGNAVAGVILTYMRAFQVGDRIMVDNTVGDVLERTLLVTRLKTPKNERITIPNSKILSGSIINYTYSASQYKVIVYTSITIGYDVDWHVVHRLMIEAAKEIEEVADTPTPFVRQKSLDDFYVTYEINAYTTHEKKIQSILSKLHENIQEKFHSEGVEIMSPHYRVARVNEDPAIPRDYLKEK